MLNEILKTFFLKKLAKGSDIHWVVVMKIVSAVFLESINVLIFLVL